MGDAGVVDQDIQGLRATLDGGEHGVDLGFVTDIRHYPHGFTTLRFNGRDDGLGRGRLGRVGIIDVNPGAAAGIGLGDRRPDT